MSALYEAIVLSRISFDSAASPSCHLISDVSSKSLDIIVLSSSPEHGAFTVSNPTLYTLPASGISISSSFKVMDESFDSPVSKVTSQLSGTSS